MAGDPIISIEWKGMGEEEEMEKKDFLFTFFVPETFCCIIHRKFPHGDNIQRLRN
jgi:hypothetical protein